MCFAVTAFFVTAVLNMICFPTGSLESVVTPIERALADKNQSRMRHNKSDDETGECLQRMTQSAGISEPVFGGWWAVNV